MELGKDFSSHFKAKNFLGFLSIRNGVFVTSFTQLLFGVALYCILHYLHPSLHGVAWFLLGLHVLVAVLGYVFLCLKLCRFVGALKRSLGFHATYMVFYAVSMVFVAMIALDMSELVHFLPKAPQMHDFSMFQTNTPLITKFKSPNSKVLFPFNFYKDPFLTNNMPDLSDLGNGKLIAKYSVTEIDLHNPQNPIVSYSGTISNEPFDANSPNGNMDGTTGLPTSAGDAGLDDLDKLKKLLREKLNDSNPTNSTDNNSGPRSDTAYPVGATPSSSPTTATTPDNNPTSSPTSAPTATPDKPASQSGGDKDDSLYDHIPFLPHPGETEGESEEVSKDEFPPETNDLSPEGKSEVVVMYKMQKRSVKFAASAFLLVCLIFYMYSFWVAFTFAMNKCTCLDELSAQPDQFTPLVD
ncbi:conserved hypothetical protein [Theileria orientalis strain Shintoku]|uniref:Uncharacterized protein n=1 Tax=Theileria orientalis strain Shintoku TaxID=869250 RepID=J7MGV4_THEOR|nr:conserved hypothetical protein [Theileria orientalis strain Shintoku]BAM38801.1 conserved hypothetical protein [Theileria orientalis strain Shintoku]|eukprot:XP_009689102.1 conserved hypothetical protein [Theileria orientalis strain Shintoku]